MEVYEFEQFIAQYEKDIYSFCCHLTMNTDLANDLYQDTILQAFKIIDRIDITNNPKSFILSIAIKKFKNEQRKNKRRNELAPTLLYEDLQEEIADSKTIESLVEKNTLKAHIKNVIGQMDIKYRVPMILHYFENGSIEEISKICNIPKGTVKSRLSKGRELMKAALLKEGYSFE